jgi:hypothetical protein
MVLGSITSFFYPRHLNRDDAEEVRKYRVLINTSLLTGLFAFSYLWVSYFIEFPAGVQSMIASSVFYAVFPFAVKAGARFTLLVHILSAQIVLLNIYITVHSGGLLISSLPPWLLVVPLLALLLTEMRIGLFWLGISLLVMGVFATAHFLGYEYDNQLTRQADLILKSTAYMGIVLITYLIVSIFDREKTSAMEKVDRKNQELNAANASIQANLRLMEEQKNRIDQEKQKSDNLLLNILPQEIADELSASGHSQPRGYACVSVMFTDFVGFSTIARTMTPRKIVQELDYYFKRFDDVMHKYQIEKIKTIGDSYMCAAGLPIENDTHPIDLVSAGLELIKICEEIKKERTESPNFDLRIGIHTGPLLLG